ncbi:3-phenylpropionate/trans-cinnamate dioxygenase ferredoxin reductase subunit [Bradyrhizobium sp. AZCC 2262]|uniref:NAD(P)/FAD-dependent oxidoreductase n=1 Tax=Bradyrhizobium sp. AZCC 2262 TaxID=3117022 RepID=UPI002FEEA441
MTKGPVVIAGAGHAGFQLAAGLRQGGFTEPVTLLNGEGHLPYHRPPLSKAYLNSGPNTPVFRPAKFYFDQKIDLIEDRAISIDRAARKVSLASGYSLDYGHLVLATGARNRPLDIPNAKLDGVRYLRTIDEAEALRHRIASGQRAVVIGAGFIGLEFAATARAKGLDVDVVEIGTRVMARAVTAEISEFFQKQHTAADIRIHFGVHVTRIEADGGKVTGVSLSNGRRLPTELVVVGVGVLPNVELATDAGLPVAAGVIVDKHLRTADPNISAIGDCAQYASHRFGGSMRLESVQNATDHARCLAVQLTGNAKPYDDMPWFWSDQGSSKLQIVGLTTGSDQVVVRGDRASGSFSAFCYKAGKLLGIESVNNTSDHMIGRRLLAANRSITPEQAADNGFDLKSVLT